MNTKFSHEEDEKLIDLVRRFPPVYKAKSRGYKDSVLKNNIWKKIAEKMGRSDADCKGRWKSIRDYYQRKKRDYLKGTGTGSAKEDQEDNFSKKFKHLRFLDSTSMVERRTISSSNENSSSMDTDVDRENSPEDNDVSQEVDNSQQTQEAHDTQAAHETPEAQKEEHSKESQDAVPNARQANESPKNRKRSRPTQDRQLLVFNEIKKGRTERTALLRELMLNKTQQQPAPEGDVAISMFFKSVASTVSAFSPILKAKLKVEIMNLVSRYEIEHATQLSEAALPVHNRWPASSGGAIFTHDYDQPCTSANVYDADSLRSASASSYAFSPESGTLELL